MSHLPSLKISRTIKSLSNHPISIGFLVLLLLLIFISIVLSKHAWDPHTFIILGTRYTEGDYHGDYGYDGQFAYFIAQEPLEAMPRLDHAPYRYQKILYPLLIWTLSFGGHETLLPWAMLAVNLVSIVLISVILAVILKKRGIPIWVSLSCIFFIGFWITLRGNLTEPLMLLLALLGVFLVFREKWGWAGVFFHWLF